MARWHLKTGDVSDTHSLSVFMEQDVPVNLLARLATGHFNGSKRPGLVLHAPITSLIFYFCILCMLEIRSLVFDWKWSELT